MPRPAAVALHRLLLPLLALVALLAAAPGALAACANEDVAASDPTAVTATLCLLNQQRAANGLAALTESTTLDRAASGYAADMVDRQFFNHVSPGGGTMMDRIKAAGWLPPGAWSAGENIAWGSGDLATPASIVDGWMHSAGHRANILTAGFAQIGIGIAEGAPQSGIDGEAGTYVTDFTSGTARAASVKTKRAARCSTRSGKRRCAKEARRPARPSAKR